MTQHVEVRPGVYHDSVSLMQVSRAVGDVEGVDGALIAMATELNLGFLDTMGFGTAGIDAGPNDLLVAIRARDDDAVQAALAALERELAAISSGGATSFGDAPPPRTIGNAARLDDPDLALVSVPGEYAFLEAMDAVRAGLHVMVFSDNVPIGQEVALKRAARERGVLVMGPDAGTAIVNGVGLGFANVVRPGPVGIVAASGTGAQQLTCLLDDAGVGVRHVLGVGGRDLKSEVGGIATMQATEALDADPATELIVVLSKPPAKDVADAVREAADRLSTPTVVAFIGPDGDDLTTTARTVVERVGAAWKAPTRWDAPQPPSPTTGHLKGLFAGGTLAIEALVLATDALGPVRSNVPLDPTLALDGAITADAHTIVDLGEDEYTRGRPHPMIDQQLRVERLQAEAADPNTAVVLLDVVLGHAAHPDPAAELAPAIRAARQTATDDGRDLAVVVSLCGASGDPQGRDRQAEALRDAGASVHLSNAEAARTAAALITGGTA